MSNPDLIADQLLFQRTFQHGILPTPTIPLEGVQERRRMLVTEEYREFITAWEACNNLERLPKDEPARKELEAEALASLADAIADSIYVLIGTAFEYGLPLAAVWQAVQKANMDKLWTWEQVLTKTPAGTVSHPWTATTPFPLSGAWSAHRVLVHPYAGLRYVVHNQYGKVQKPPNWQPPDIVGIIKAALITPPEEQANRDAWKKALAEAVLEEGNLGSDP